MWLLSFIPDSWLWQSVLATLWGGLGLYLFGLVMDFIPPLKPYREPVRIVSTILIIVGIYFYGSYDNEKHWRAKAAEMQAQLDKKNTASKSASVKIVTKYVTKTKVIKEKGDVIVKEVPKYITKNADANCVIPKSFVLLHDSAAKGTVPDTSAGVDESASGTKLSTVAETVTINYNNYHQLSEQLKALQDWVTQQEKIYNGK
jgi:hypothetical protein